MTRATQTLVVPSARRLMASLRDIGYDLSAAVADLVDNSVDAGATEIDITLHDAGEESWLRVADNGIGMQRAELDEAMRYGSERSYGRTDLGHFGLGLKTASLSQARCLTVASRKGERGRISVRRWDIDRIAAEDEWLLESPPRPEWPSHLFEPLADAPGTVVLWQRLDRLLAFRRPNSAATSRALRAMATDIAEHLGMVFHRFISGEASDGRRAIRITVNDEPIAAWDPFARSEPRTRALSPQRLPLETADGTTVEVEVSAYILPAQQAFSSQEAHQRAAGPGRWNRQQGLYIYRRERLIQSGGWNRLRTMDEHSKLARIAIDLPAGGEEAFQINVAKMNVVLPESLRADLRALASSVVAEAQRSYREHAGDSATVHRDGTPRNRVAAPTEALIGPHISRHWLAITRIVSDELNSDPPLRDRLLLRLANASTDSLADDSTAEIDLDLASEPALAINSG
jgi:Histidine kinase-, DNA gyrase B-, and HSP90-like ATPase